MNQADVTVVITSYQRPDDLAECVRSLASTGAEPGGILVVARTSDEETADAASQLGTQLVRVERPGVAAAVQAAIEAATTEILWFIDDDARAREGWRSRILDAFNANASLGFLGGRDNLGGDSTAGSDDITVGRIRRGTLVGNHHLGRGGLRSADLVKGANMAFRTAAVRGVPYAELVAGSGAQYRSELFYSLAARSAGYEGAYDPRIQVDHYPAARNTGDERDVLSSERVSLDTRNTLVAFMLFTTLVTWWAVLARVVLVGDKDRPGVAWTIRWLLRGRYRGKAFAAVLRGVRQSAVDLPPARRVLEASEWARARAAA